MKRTGKTLKGLSIIDVLTGKSLGQVHDLLIDLKEVSLYGLVAVKGRLFEKQRRIPFQHSLGVGQDAIMLEYRREDLDEEVEYRRFSQILHHRMVTVNGDFFGELADILIHLSTGKIEEYLFHPVNDDSTLYMLSSQNIHLLGEDIIIVDRDSPEKARPFQEEEVNGKGSTTPLWYDIKEELGELQERFKSISPKSIKRLTGIGKGEEMAEEILVEGVDLKGRKLSKHITDERGEILAKKGTPLSRELVQDLMALNLLPELLESLED